VGIADEKAKGPQRTQSVEDKMAALIAYRMARGMCKKCGENGEEAISVPPLSN
jgi:hypothetical protein